MLRSIRSNCKECPFKKECCGNKRRQSLTFSVYRHYHKQMQERVESKEGKRMKGQRMATVEPVFGSLLNYYGMKRSNSKGKQAAHKFMLNLLRVCIGFGQLQLTTCRNCSLALLILKPMFNSLLLNKYIPFILCSATLCNTQGELF
ncbi:transposase [Rhodocytophaga aerolata]|uniref:transposase n=1 Tax=Rhodocytophaga aerolata TaxID=455078 RepID=UPI003457E0B2